MSGKWGNLPFLWEPLFASFFWIQEAVNFSGKKAATNGKSFFFGVIKPKRFGAWSATMYYSINLPLHQRILLDLSSQALIAELHVFSYRENWILRCHKIALWRHLKEENFKEHMRIMISFLEPRLWRSRNSDLIANTEFIYTLINMILESRWNCPRYV